MQSDIRVRDILPSTLRIRPPSLRTFRRTSISIDHMRLMPNGDVMTCVYYPVVVGNLRAQSLKDVWYGDAIKPQRRVVQKCPGCWAGCEAKPNAIYSGDIVKALWMGPVSDRTRDAAMPQVQPEQATPEPEVEHENSGAPLMLLD